MKIIPLLILGACLVSPLQAEFRTWTKKDGNTARLELISKSGEGEEMRASFRMLSGKTVEVPVSELSEADITLVKEWEPGKAVASESANSTPSVFDDVLDGNLEKLDGNSLKRYELEQKPTKYYVFYYTASWCGPCQRFTPSLVDFYNKHKEGNDSFEIVLITSDRDEKAMEGYAKNKKMPWPHLKLSKAPSFKKKFSHGVRGIPSVIVCDLEGNIVSRDGRNLAELEKLVN
ncbi:MAG: thioredoxin-like domain-containing protein [Akkermansiaceae bacterium]